MTVLHFEGLDDLPLVGERWGDADAQPVLFLHGGGQTRHSWGGAAASFAARGWQAIALDLRGDGESAWSPAGDYRLTSFAEDVRRVVATFDRPPVLVGASLGGLTSMLLTGELAPGIARAVVLVDVVPDMEPTGQHRIHSFMVERARLGFDSVDEVVDAIAAYNPHRPRPNDAAGLRKNLRERDGRFFWHWDPDFMDGGKGRVPEEIADVDRLHAAVARMVADVPVLLVRGQVSDLVSEEKAEQFLARFPGVEFIDVSGAGHMVAGDRNDAFTASIVDFIERQREQHDARP